jgi:hypothetical protein
MLRATPPPDDDVEHDGPALSVVSPCYNEVEVLPEFHRRVTAACAPLGRTYEIVLVNDGSRDGTTELLDRLAGADPHVVVVHLSRNHGQQLALTAGLSVCRGADVLVIDADLQDPPELLADMLARRAAGADVVYGQRRRRAGERAFKRATSFLFYRGLAALTEADIPQDTGDFRLMSRRVVDWLLAMPERRRFVRGMVSWIGFRQEPLLYDRDARFAGETKWPLRQMMRLAIDAVTSFSIKPLLAAAWLAVATGLLAAGVATWATVAWVSGAGPGGLFLAALMLGLTAMQCTVLAIQGQYLGRLCEEGRDRPLFIIDRIEDAAGRHAVAPPRPTDMRQPRRAA